MKTNAIIAFLVVTVLALGGWIVYDKTSHSASRDSQSYGASDSSQSAKPSASPDNGKVLDYSHQGLTAVGSNIYKQTDATQLILSYNSLHSLPSQMGGMGKLQVLRVDHNQLQGALIAEIRKMPLITLDASNNGLTGVPAEVGQLNQLQTLNLSNNKISALPNEIANIKQLKTLDLTGNPLPESQISRLKAELPDTTIVF